MNKILNFFKKLITGSRPKKPESPKEDPLKDPLKESHFQQETPSGESFKEQTQE